MNTMDYQRRILDEELNELLAQLSAILIDGPKAVGKTTTAIQRCATVRRLQRAAERAVVEADPRVIAKDPAPVLLDEWQRVPEVWDTVRDLVDEDNTAGRFVLTGSSPLFGTHSGAARIATVRLRPLTLSERGVGSALISFRSLLDGGKQHITGRSNLELSNYVDEIIAGGFPGMRHLTGRALTTQIDSYLDRIVTHDIPETGFRVRRPAAVRAWMAAYAAATATTTSWESLRDAASAGYGSKPSKVSTSNYTNLLTQLRILDPIEAWLPSTNHFSRLGSAPKHHLADPALAARLLKRTRHHLLHGEDGPLVVARDGTLLGALFESLVALSVRVFAQAAGAETYHFRDRNGRHEVDFIVEHEGKVLGLEAKLRGDVRDADVRHLLWLREQLGNRMLDAVVITTGQEAYRRADGIAVIPLGVLGP
jgi:predicted AAA+ superfamily ATPase